MGVPDGKLMIMSTEMSPEEEKEEQARLTEKFKPLIEWLRKEVREKGAARDGQCIVVSTLVTANVSSTVVISNRLVTSSCAIVADESGYTANLEKLISTSLPQYLTLPHSLTD